MNSYSLFKFAVVKDVEVDGNKTQRVYQLEVQPGAPWDEMFEVLEQFKNDFAQLKADVEAAEKKKADDTEVLEPELVQK